MLYFPRFLTNSRLNLIACLKFLPCSCSVYIDTGKYVIICVCVNIVHCWKLYSYYFFVGSEYQNGYYNKNVEMIFCML